MSLLNHVHWVGDTIQPFHPLSSPLLPSIFPSIRVISNESAFHIRWQKDWSFSVSIIPSNEYSGLIFFRMDWFDLLAVQGTLRNLLQHHSLKASILWCSSFFLVQLSHPYTATGKTIALIIRTFVDKVMSFLFNTLSRFVIAFLPRSKCLLISRLQSPSAVIFQPNKLKSNPFLLCALSSFTCSQEAACRGLVPSPQVQSSWCKVTWLTSQLHWSCEQVLCLIPHSKMAAAGHVQRCYTQHRESEHTCASPDRAPLLPGSWDPWKAVPPAYGFQEEDPVLPPLRSFANERIHLSFPSVLN